MSRSQKRERFPPGKIFLTAGRPGHKGLPDCPLLTSALHLSFLYPTFVLHSSYIRLTCDRIDQIPGQFYCKFPFYWL